MDLVVMERERAATTDEGAFCRFRQCSFRQRPRSRRGGAGAHRWRCNAARSPCLPAVAMPTDRQSARCPGARFPPARPRCPPGAAAARRSPTCQPPPRDIGVRSAPTQPPTGSRGALVTDLAGASADRHARDPVRPPDRPRSAPHGQLDGRDPHGCSDQGVIDARPAFMARCAALEPRSEPARAARRRPAMQPVSRLRRPLRDPRHPSPGPPLSSPARATAGGTTLPAHTHTDSQSGICRGGEVGHPTEGEIRHGTRRNPRQG